MGSVTKRLDVVAGRKYESRGETKTHWINVGEAAEWDDGGITLRLHAVPCGSWWDGTLKLFERKQQDEPQRGGGGIARPARQGAKPAADEMPDDDLPFVTNRSVW
jgi:hypothetical protein